MKIKLGYLVIGCVLFAGCTPSTRKESAIHVGKDWPAYGGNKAGNRFSPLTQINVANVKDLKLAWTYDANDPPDSSRGRQWAREIQCQPIVIRGVMYGTNATLKLFAIDAATGKQHWQFDPFAHTRPSYHPSRGVVYWEQGDDHRILYTAGSYLYAVNADNGQAILSFGDSGRVSLNEGLNINYEIGPRAVRATSPGVAYDNVYVLGSSVSEGGDAAPGYVRGFDIVSGKLLWTFHTIPQPGEPGYDTWPKGAYKLIGGVNNWSGMVVDNKRGMVFFGTGSPGSDFYGGERAGKNLYANCIIALDAKTGKLKWYYQTIHHDLWDRDIPCPPNLATVMHNGKPVDVVVQATKDGLVYVLDRDKGTSIFPVEERPVDTTGALPGEHPWPTQKFPSKPLPFANQIFADTDVTNISKESHDYVVAHYMHARHGKKFLPPSTQGTLLFGYSGGAEWGGNAIDSNGILYQNANHAPWLLEMISAKERQKEVASLRPGQAAYVANCSACHGMNRKGDGKGIPDLTHIGSQLSRQQIASVLEAGRGRMPSFGSLPNKQRNAIIDYLLGVKPSAAARADEHKPAVQEDEAPAVQTNYPYHPTYVSKVWKKMVDQDGYPGVKPPWGTLSAIDLNTGDYLWTVTLGEYPELVKKGIPPTGTESYGGPVVTAGGLVFIAGTRDEKFRAFDRKTGKVVWEYQLPAGGFATPVSYEINGVQYIALAVGGARGLKAGGYYMAFALPADKR